MATKDHYVNRLRIDPVIDRGIQDYCARHHIKRTVGTRQIIVAGLKALQSWPEAMLHSASPTMLVDERGDYITDGGKDGE